MSSASLYGSPGESDNALVSDFTTGKLEEGGDADYVHIRLQQRNGRKTLTTLQGLSKKSMFRFPQYFRLPEPIP